MYMCKSEHVLIPLGHAGARAIPSHRVRERHSQAACGQPLTHQSCDLGQVFSASAPTSQNKDDNSSDLEIAVRTCQVHVPGTKDAFHKW